MDEDEEKAFEEIKKDLRMLYNNDNVELEHENIVNDIIDKLETLIEDGEDNF